MAAAITWGQVGALQCTPFTPESRRVLRWNLAFKMWNQACWLLRLVVSKRLRGNRRRICRRRERACHFSRCSLNCVWIFQWRCPAIRSGAGSPGAGSIDPPSLGEKLHVWVCVVSLLRFGELHPRWPECFRHPGCSCKKVPIRVIPAVLAGAKVALELLGCRCVLGSP